MEFLLAVIVPILILAGCLVAIRIVRNRQRSAELGEMAPPVDGESTASEPDLADGVPAEPIGGDSAADR